MNKTVDFKQAFQFKLATEKVMLVITKPNLVRGKGPSPLDVRMCSDY